MKIPDNLRQKILSAKTPAAMDGALALLDQLSAPEVKENTRLQGNLWLAFDNDVTSRETVQAVLEKIINYYHFTVHPGIGQVHFRGDMMAGRIVELLSLDFATGAEIYDERDIGGTRGASGEGGRGR